MNSYSTKCLTMIAVTALLSACARERELAPPQPGWSLITQQKVIIKGESQPLEGAESRL